MYQGILFISVFSLIYLFLVLSSFSSHFKSNIYISHLAYKNGEIIS